MSSAVLPGEGAEDVSERSAVDDAAPTPVPAGAGPQPAGSSADGSDIAWRDPKRYAWLLGAIVPLLPFMAWGLVS